MAQGWESLREVRNFNPRAYNFASTEDSIRASWYWYEEGRRRMESDRRTSWEALLDFERALELNPQNIEAYNLKSDILLSLNRRKSSIDALSQALCIDSTRVDLWLKKATRCIGREWLTEGIEAYECLLRFEPEEKQHYVSLVELYGQYHWERKADELWETIHRKWPEDAALWKKHGQVLYASQQWQEFVSLMNRALAYHPDRIDLRFFKLEHLKGPDAITNKENESLEILKRDTTLDTRVRVYAYMQTVYTTAGQWDKAFALTDSLIVLEPNQAWTWQSRGALGEKVGRSLAEQLADFDSAIVRYPREADGTPLFPDVWLGKCKVLTELGRYEEALAILDSLIAMKSDWQGVWSSKAYILAQFGDTSGALSCIDRELQLNSADEWARAFRSQLLRGTEQKHTVEGKKTFSPLMVIPGGVEGVDSATRIMIDSAWEAAHNATAEDSASAWQYFNIAFHEATQPQYLDTCGILGGVIPDPEDYNEFWINAQLLTIGGKIEDAEKAWTRVIETGGVMNTEVLCQRARMRARLGMREQALDDLARVVEIDPRLGRWICVDYDLRSLWNDSTFLKIVAGEK